MKVIITSDWHFGYQGRLEEQVIVIRRLIEYCVNNDIHLIVLLGDLAHDRESMAHDVSNAISILLDEMEINGITLLSLVGNHDMYYRYKWSVNAIKPFNKQLICVDNLSYFSLEGRKFWCIPFIEHENYYMKILSKVNELANEEDILLTHVGVANAVMNMCFLIQNWSVVNMDNVKFNKVYSGHFHCTQKVGDKCYYPGSLLSFRFDEGLVEHGFFVYDTDKNDHVFIKTSEITKDEIIRDYITIEHDHIDQIINDCSGHNVRVLLLDDSDKDKILEKLNLAGASRVIFVKPKETKRNFTDIQSKIKSDDMFELWLNFDNPSTLNHDLLLKLEKEIRSDTKVCDD